MNGFSDIFSATKKLWPANIFRDTAISGRLVLLAVLGVGLLLFGSFIDTQPAKSRTDQPAETVRNVPTVNRSYEEALEAKLANLLSQVKGAGAVTVSITLENGSANEFAKNTTKESKTIQEKDTAGGIRTTTESKESDQILLSKENGLDRPVTVREIKPVIKGVLVIAEGAQDSVVKANLTRAVEAGLGIPVYKITVLPQRK
jgi:stage III sporulation protein AG